MQLKRIIVTHLFILSLLSANAQQAHNTEAQATNDSIAALTTTTIGGYGNAYYKRDNNSQQATLNMERFVVFVGHKFSKNISLLSELEVEDAKVAGGDIGGEVALEQCYLKFKINPTNYFVTGLFIPSIGIINENHLPNSFHSNERPQVESKIIPTTWRELGVGFFGTLNRVPISYSLSIINGLNSAAFKHGTVIRKGRMEGSNASANNLAVTGAIQCSKNSFKAHLSGYYGGTVGVAKRIADTLKLSAGILGTPVFLGEADIQYELEGFSLRLLGSMISIPDAAKINNAYHSNTPKTAFGAYAELSYNLFQKMSSPQAKQLLLFVRYEWLDLNATIPNNGVMDKTLQQQHLTTGIHFLPIPNISIKADLRFQQTGPENPLLINPPSTTPPVYQKGNRFFYLGIGYSF